MSPEKFKPLNPRPVDPVELARTVRGIAEKSRQIVRSSLEREEAFTHISVAEAAHFTEMYQTFVSRLLRDPFRLAGAQIEFWNNYFGLIKNIASRFMGLSPEPVVIPQKGDRRFKSDAWEQNPLFDYIKQTYLLGANYYRALVKDFEKNGIDPKTAAKIEFYTEQFVDALSPTNFIATNPDVLRETIESRGQNLLKGFQNLLGDIERGNGTLKISMTDLSAFKLGENIAVTPGKIIHQNDMMQLIQYSPSTEDVNKRPIMIIPPWINKYYILDLRPANSMIKWLVDQGHTVFLISWVNPDQRHQSKGFEDYMIDGPLAALDVIAKVADTDEINSIGYCLGGTLQTCMLSYLAQKGDDRVKSATFFTSLINFEHPGELEVFIDEQQIQNLEKKMSKKGYLEGKVLATTFNMLRANDLIWSYYVNNYLLGQSPIPFDLLYWNSDSTNMPARMHSFYLRNMYQKNLMIQPGGISLSGVPIDISKIKVPCYFISAIEDHIAPWKSTYEGAVLLNTDVKFVLGGSGHIAGIINPPTKTKYCYWTNPAKKLAKTPEAWFEKAVETPGSWWPDYDNWLKAANNDKVPARVPGSHKDYPAIEDAPGSYVSGPLPA